MNKLPLRLQQSSRNRIFFYLKKKANIKNNETLETTKQHHQNKDELKNFLEDSPISNR